MTDAVFDCMVFLQAVISDRGPSFACLSLVESNQVRLFTSPVILAEIRDVLTRPKLRVKFPRLTPERVDLFLHKLASIAVFVSDVPDSGIPLRDSADRPYLDLALSTRASYLVSRDNDLLDLTKDEVITNQLKGLAIVDPARFVAVANK